MAKDFFSFKQFSVSQGHCAMKVGTDGILLGAWADTTGATRILDIGAGTGIISLMAAQRNPDAKIDAIEIDNAAAEECHKNFHNSKWGDRLNVINSNFLDYQPEYTYDVIITNPPFFSEDTISPLRNRAMARNNNTLPFPNLFQHIKSLLSNSGRVSLIAPDNVKGMVEFCAGECDLWLRRRTAVRTVRNKSIKRWLWEFSDDICQPEDSELILTVNGLRSEAYKNLTEDFYL